MRYYHRQLVSREESMRGGEKPWMRKRLTFDRAFHRVHHKGDGNEQGDDLLRRPGDTRVSVSEEHQGLIKLLKIAPNKQIVLKYDF